MKIPRFLHFVTLLLAVWFPLDSALAGAVVEGCPMMSHAFTQGLAEIEQASADTAHCTMAGTDMAQQDQSTPCHQCDNSQCCALCLMLGSASLPSQHGFTTELPPGAALFADLDTVRPVAPSAPLYRPPIV